MLSAKKKLEIANICYANVAGRFAAFCNPRNRGPSFTWEGFISSCEEAADLWMILHGANTKACREIDKTAKKYAKEIATTLVGHLQE